MKKNLAEKTVYTGIGIILGILLVTNFSPGWIASLFAAEAPEIGAKNAPVVVNSSVQAINDAMVAASNAVIPTVVSISVEGDAVKGSQGLDENSPFGDFFRFFQMPDEDRKMRGSGSGVIVSSNGYIVTNNHVVENAAKDGIKVTLNDKKDYPAKLIGRDPLTDLAVIKIDAEDLPVAHFADIEKVRVGEMVIAVGNPLGLNSTVTNGIVSAIGRGEINPGGKRSSYSVENFIQTDAAINPGNSGGGLFDLSGSLVGINAAIATSTGSFVGYGFAIPIDLVKAVIEDLIDNGKIDRGFVGVQIRTIDEVFAKKLGLDKVEGVVVHDVVKDSPAQKAGLEPMDVILEINGAPVKTSNELQNKIALHRAGEKIKLTLWRDKKKIVKTVELEAQNKDSKDEIASDESGSKDSPDSAEPVKFDKLGFSVVPLDSKVKEEYDVKSGVMISNVKRFGVASDRGLFQGGVITKADDEKITSTKQLEKLLDSKSKGDVVLLQVKYKDRNQFVALEMP